MSRKEENTIAEIVQAVKESDARKTKGYDTTATVTRVEDGKAWVHIPGGVTETPADLTINAKIGDSVMVRVAGGRAFLLGNATNPPTDDATAKEALSNANSALQSAINAKLAADSAEASAETAKAAAEDAVETAEAVHDMAEQAQTDAATAKANAQTAIADAATAKSSAESAQSSADTALSQAQSATSSANSALESLSSVQDVIGVLDWAKNNAQFMLTTDTDIEQGKTYWTRSGSGTEADPYTYDPVISPVKEDLGIYYEISGVDEAMANFINTHLALTEEGLYVLGGANEWKVLIAPDGVYIIDGRSGVDKVVAQYKGTIRLGRDGFQHLDITPSSLELYDDNNRLPFVVRPSSYSNESKDRPYMVSEEVCTTNKDSGTYTLYGTIPKEIYYSQDWRYALYLNSVIYPFSLVRPTFTYTATKDDGGDYTIKYTVNIGESSGSEISELADGDTIGIVYYPSSNDDGVEIVIGNYDEVTMTINSEGITLRNPFSNTSTKVMDINRRGITLGYRNSFYSTVGNGSVVVGGKNSATETLSMAFGLDNNSLATKALAYGAYNQVESDDSIAFGYNLISPEDAYTQVVYGYLNEEDLQRAVVFGNGYKLNGSTVRRNALAFSGTNDTLLGMVTQRTGSCPTTAGTTTKVVTTTGSQKFTLQNRSVVHITFTYATTTATSLNIDGTGAKPAYYMKNGTATRITGSSEGSWSAGDEVPFVYDATNNRFIKLTFSDTDPIPSIEMQTDARLYWALYNLGWADDVLSY